MWTDADVDFRALCRTEGQAVVEQRERRENGAVALWANPLITSGVRQRRPNVLIYMIDTLRADHASLYGYCPRNHAIHEEARSSGSRIRRCHAQATWTKASTASLMTSLYSYTHGIVNDYDTISARSFTLAEQLRAAGYVTASMVANPFAGRTTGLQRGFDYMLEYPTVLRNRTEAADRGTDSMAVNKSSMPWLAEHRDEPFFLYAHTTDPHAPVPSTRSVRCTFGNPAESRRVRRAVHEAADEREYGGGTVINRASCTKAGIDPDRFIRRLWIVMTMRSCTTTTASNCSSAK